MGIKITLVLEENDDTPIAWSGRINGTFDNTTPFKVSSKISSMLSDWMRQKVTMRKKIVVTTEGEELTKDIKLDTRL